MENLYQILSRIVFYTMVMLKVGNFWFFINNLDEPNSKAYGAILNGLFDGHIFLNGASYTVEKSIKYFTDPTFHSIIYEDKNVKNFRLKRDLNFDRSENSVFKDFTNSNKSKLKKLLLFQILDGCALDNKRMENMKRIQESADLPVFFNAKSDLHTSFEDDDFSFPYRCVKTY